MKRIVLLVSGLLLAATAVAPAAWADDEMEPLKFKSDVGNVAAVQRGGRDFLAYCSGCHSLKYLRYNRVGADLGIPDDLVKQNLIFSDAKIGDTIQSAMPAQSADWFGRVPPDLSLEVKAKGADWVYSYLQSFYLDDKRPMGVNNVYLPGVSMPAVLGELQGWQKMVTRKEKVGDGEKDVFDHLESVQPGSMSPEEFKAFVSDLTNFLDYASEPGQTQRVALGLPVMLYLVVLLILCYLLKKEFWKDVH